MTVAYTVSDLYGASSTANLVLTVTGASDAPVVSGIAPDNGPSATDGVTNAQTLVIGGNLVKVVTWYDNEWGYACRVADLVAYMGARAGQAIDVKPVSVARALQHA